MTTTTKYKRALTATTATEATNYAGTLFLAQRKARESGRGTFVHQTGPESFEYRFVCDGAGVLVARFDGEGQPC